MLCLQGDDAQKAAAAEVLCIVLEVVRIASVALYPLTPALSQRCWQQLGLGEAYGAGLSWSATAWGGMPEGHLTNAASAQPVFGRLMTPAEREKAALEAAGGVAKPAKQPKQPKQKKEKQPKKEEQATEVAAATTSA